MLPTDSQQARKRRKPKRSLRKIARIPIDPNTCLGVDMSQKELNEIFTGLNTGTLENPQQALAKVYTVALDALQNTLREGVDSLCRQVVDATRSADSSDNLFAPWLKRILPSDPARIESFRDGFLERVSDGIEKIEKSLHAAYEADARGENRIGRPGLQAAEAIRDVLDNPGVLSAFGRYQMSPERLRQIMRELRVPENTVQSRDYRITERPGAYRFSFGGGQARFVSDDSGLRIRVKPSDKASGASESAGCDDALASDGGVDAAGTEPEGGLVEDSAETSGMFGEAAAPKTHESPAPENGGAPLQAQDERGDAEVAVAQEPCGNAAPEVAQRGAESDAVRAVNQAIGAFAGQIGDALAPGKAQDWKAGAESVVAVASEVTAVMQEIAMQIARATMQAYSERQFIPSLRESLRDDPRLEADRELAGFIDELEQPTEQDGAAPDNDELANAFAILLGKL